MTRIGEKRLSKRFIFGVEAYHEQNIGRDLSDRHPLLCAPARKWGGRVDQVLDQPPEVVRSVRR